jgi:hypothetical protein
MSQLRYLNPDQSPPDDQDWMMVEDVTTGYVVKEAAASIAVVTKALYSSFDTALAAATEYANRCEIELVFARGIAPPARGGKTD